MTVVMNMHKPYFILFTHLNMSFGWSNMSDTIYWLQGDFKSKSTFQSWVRCWNAQHHANQLVCSRETKCCPSHSVSSLPCHSTLEPEWRPM